MNITPTSNESINSESALEGSTGSYYSQGPLPCVFLSSTQRLYFQNHFSAYYPPRIRARAFPPVELPPSCCFDLYHSVPAGITGKGGCRGKREGGAVRTSQSEASLFAMRLHNRCCRVVKQCSWSEARHRKYLNLVGRSSVPPSQCYWSVPKSFAPALPGAAVVYLPPRFLHAGYVLGNVDTPALGFETAEHSHKQTRPLVPCPATHINARDGGRFIATHRKCMSYRNWLVP